MLDDRRCGNFTRFAILEGRQDVDLSHDIAVRLKATERAAKDAPSWFVSLATIRTSLAGVMFVYEDDGDAHRVGLVLGHFADFAMRPTADLLVGLLAERRSIGHSADVAHRNRAGLSLDRHIDNGPADLVFDVADNTRVVRFHAGLGAHEFLVALRAFNLTADGAVDSSQALGVSLRFVATFTAQNERGLDFIANGGWVDFAQIDRDGIRTIRLLGLLSVFDHNMPHIAAGTFVVDQPYFLKAQDGWKVRRQGDSDLGVSHPVGQFQSSSDVLDRRVFPHCRAELLRPVRILSLRIDLLCCLRRLTRLIEALLGRINAVRVQRRFGEKVAQARPRFLGQPDTFLAHDAPVRHQNARVDATACQIERIGKRAAERARNLVSANQHAFPSKLHRRVCRMSTGFARDCACPKKRLTTATPVAWLAAR